MWVDRLTTRFKGKPAKVVRLSDGPAYDEQMEVMFEDGSTLRIKYEANLEGTAADYASEIDVMEAGSQTQAYGVWGPWVKEVFDHSRPDSYIDTDDEVVLQLRQDG